jgi:ubiquinone/menaquinone biosynthesis C-methylase UbiE
MNSPKDPKKRFSDRVDNYVKYRPSYPKEAIDFLYNDLGFSSHSTIADLGSGTGIFTKLLLDRGSLVLAIEPNTAMREAAEAQLSEYDNFTSLTGTAEDTKLTASSVDFIISAQAFHWFDKKLARVEFARILKPEGKVVLIWNHRQIAQSSFDHAYEEMLKKFGTDYEQVKQAKINEKDYKEFFKEGQYKKDIFANRQVFDFAGLQGRLLSSSYTPLPNEPNHDALMQELLRIFDLYNENGMITLFYDTELFYGEIGR